MEVLTAYFASVLATVTVEALKAAFSSEKVNVERAIETTCAEFPQFDRLSSDLKEWIESDAFWEMFNAIAEGQRGLDPESVVESFCKHSQHWAPPGHENRKPTEDVIFRFLGAISDEIHRSDFAHSAMANRGEVIHLEDTNRFDQIQNSLGKIETSVGRLEARAAATAVAGDAGGGTSTQHEEERAKIDRARDLIEIEQVGRAKRELLSLGDGSELPAELRFRLITNLGACALAEGNDDSACSYFEQAYETEPENPKAISNVAVAALLRDDFESAISLAHNALERNGEDGHAAAVIIESLWESGQGERLRDFVASHPWSAKDRQSSLVLADVRVKQARYEEAQQLCRSILHEDADDFGAHLMLSQCLLAEAQANFAVGGDDGEAQSARLEEAESSASRAIELLESTERRSHLSEALVARAFIRGIRAQHEAALDDLVAARLATPDKASVYLVRGLVLLSAGRHQEARGAFQRVQSLDQSMDVTAPLAEVLFRTGADQAAASLVRGRFSFEQAGPDDLWKAELVCRGELASGEADPGWASFEAAIDERPDDPWLLGVSAIRSRIAGEFEIAEQLFQRAVSLTRGGQQAEIKFRLGSLYQEWNRFSDAAGVYEEMAGGSGKHPVAVDLLVCLVNAKRLREALLWARRIHSERQNVPKVVLDAEAQILEIAGDLRVATSLREEICEREDSTPLDRVGLAVAQFRAGEKEDAAETANSIDSKEVANDPLLLIRLAKLKRVLQLPGWLEDAFLARRFGGDNPETHVVYFGMFVMQQGEFIEPEIVEPGHAVQLRNTRTEERRWWLILEDGEEPQGPNESRRTSEPAQLLIGRRVGEVVPFRSGIEELDYEVLSVQSKYVRAFQETADEFSTRFPDHPGLHRVDAADGDFTKLFVMADQQNQQTQRAEAVYLSARPQLPFASFASLLQQSVLEVWSACTNRESVPIRFASGEPESVARMAELLFEAEGVVLDLISLTTIYKLEFGEQLRSRFSMIAVPQYVIDELRDAHDMAVSLRAEGRFGKTDDGRYFFVEQSDSRAIEWEAFTQELLDFAESFERIPSHGVLDLGDTEPMIQTFTAAGVATIYADDQLEGTPLLLVSDDLGLADIARALGKRVVNSQGLVFELRRSGKITADDHSAAVEQLASMNYSFVCVEPDDLVRRVRSNGYKSSEGILAMIRTLQGPDCTQESAVQVAAQVLVELSGEAPLSGLLLILDLLVADLRHERDAKQVLSQLAQMLPSSSKLGIMPWVRNALLSSIRLHAGFAPNV